MPATLQIHRLDKSFYLQDVMPCSLALLGKKLFTRFDGKTTAGIITETEAYNGIYDRASHAYNGRRTSRTEIMYREGGVAYVYLCYGLHSLFNVVVNQKDVPQAILIRSIRPAEGIEFMLERRKWKSPDKEFTKGPGNVAQALGIHYSHSGVSLLGNRIWIEDAPPVHRSRITVSARIGVDYAGRDALLPYRFILKN